LRAGDFGVADSILRRRAHDDPNGDGSWLLGISLRYQGRLRDALATTRHAQIRQPHTPSEAPIGIAEAIVLFEMGRYDESAEAFRKIAATPAYSPQFRARIARDRAWNLTHEATARAAAGDTAALSVLADSIESAARASAYGRDRRLHHYVRGLLLRARGEPESAVVEFRRAIFSLTEGYTRDNYELARTLLSLHRPKEAIAVLQPALRGSMQASNSYITYSEIHELLAQAFDAAGRSDSAATHYAYVVRAWPAADPDFRARFLAARERLAALRPHAAAR
jgi:tetratricopeptide (TPR) repeat protein